VHGLFDRINVSTILLQSRNLLMTEQETEIHGLIEIPKHMTEAEGPLSPEEVAQLPDNFTVGGWTISSESVTGFLNDQGLLIHDIMESFPNNVRLAVQAEVGEFIVDLIDSISRICTLSDFESKLIEENFPSVLPAYLGKLRGRDFLPLNVLHQITSEQIQLFKACQTEFTLKAALDERNDLSFEKNWDIVKDRFPVLRAFARALFTVFPNTSSIESEFSVVGWEKDEHRESLSNLSLEDILQAKQFDHLQKTK
jgi:hypothetical protein